MWVIAAREFRALFLSPLAWSILGIVQFIFGWTFGWLVYLVAQPQVKAGLANNPEAMDLSNIVIVALFDWLGVVLLLVTPLLTMRLISDERRNKTLALLLSAPVSMTSIILGKFLGLMGFFLVMLGMITLMPLSLLLGGTLDFGQLAACLIASLCMLATCSAIGLYISTLTAQPTVAAMTTLGSLLLLWMLDWGSSIEEQSAVLTYLSITSHYQALTKGLFDTQDIIYYLLVTALFLVLSIHHLDTDRV